MMKNIKTGAYINGEESYTFNFGTDLSISDKAKFVNFTTKLVVDDKDYNSVIRDLVFDFCVIEFMTDIDTTKLKKSSAFVSDVEEFLENTNVVDIVKDNMVDGLLDELNEAVNNSIAYRTGIKFNPLTESLVNLINSFEKKLKDFDMDSMMEMAKTFTGVTDELTSESIVNAYLDSNIHKKKMVEIEESKKRRDNMIDNIINITDKK